jgi:hypothetical protein
MAGLLIGNQMLKPDPGTTGAWLFDGASRGLIIGITLLVVVLFVAFGLFLAYQHFMDTYYPDRFHERDMALLEQITIADRESARRPARSRSSAPPTAPPTAPLPVAPDDHPTAVVRE